MRLTRALSAAKNPAPFWKRHFLTAPYGSVITRKNRFGNKAAFVSTKTVALWLASRIATGCQARMFDEASTWYLRSVRLPMVN
jgi:hypothetical protein